MDLEGWESIFHTSRDIFSSPVRNHISFWNCCTYCQLIGFMICDRNFGWRECLEVIMSKLLKQHCHFTRLVMALSSKILQASKDRGSITSPSTLYYLPLKLEIFSNIHPSHNLWMFSLAISWQSQIFGLFHLCKYPKNSCRLLLNHPSVSSLSD